MSVQNLPSSVNEEYACLTENELANLGVVLSAYRSFRGDRRSHIAYVGMPITSGRRYFDVLSDHNVKTREELTAKLGPKAFWELVIQPNIREGTCLADCLGETQGLLFIAPSVFEATQWHWSQEAYMSLWYRVIGELAGSHYVMDGWEYSVGAVKEVVFSMILQWGIIRSYNVHDAYRIFGLRNFNMEDWLAARMMRLYDSVRIEIQIDAALAKVVGAMEDLKGRGFSYQEFGGPATSLMRIPFFSPLNGEDKIGYGGFTNTFMNARRRLYALYGKIPD